MKQPPPPCPPPEEWEFYRLTGFWRIKPPPKKKPA